MVRLSGGSTVQRESAPLEEVMSWLDTAPVGSPKNHVTTGFWQEKRTVCTVCTAGARHTPTILRAFRRLADSPLSDHIGKSLRITRVSRNASSQKTTFSNARETKELCYHRLQVIQIV